MLNNSCPRCFSICIVDCSISLEIRFIKCFCFKSNRAIFQCSKLIIKVRINSTCVYNFICHCIKFCFIFQIICIQPYFNTIQKICHHLRIATYRNSLIQCIKIIIIKCQPHRKTFNNERRKIFTITPPLFFCITFDQLFINITAYQRNCLLFQILWFCNASFFTLLFNLCCSFFWCHNPPHLIKGIHIERKTIQLTFIICNRAVCKSIELRKLCNIFPYFLIVCMENMCTILMYIDSFNFLCVNISGNVWTFVNHQNRFSCFFSFMSKNCSIKAGAYY